MEGSVSVLVEQVSGPLLHARTPTTSRSASPAPLMQRTRTVAPPALGRRRQLSPPHASVPVCFPSAVRPVLVRVKPLSSFTSKAPAIPSCQSSHVRRNQASLLLRIHPSNQRPNSLATKFPTFLFYCSISVTFRFGCSKSCALPVRPAIPPCTSVSLPLLSLHPAQYYRHGSDFRLPRHPWTAPLAGRGDRPPYPCE
jgi:hypothetical protein